MFARKFLAATVATLSLSSAVLAVTAAPASAKTRQWKRGSVWFVDNGRITCAFYPGRTICY